MADNISLPVTTTVTAAADDIGGILHQRVKLVHGIDGINDGDIAKINPLPVRLYARNTSNFGAVGCFRTLGAAAALQNIFSIENSAGSTVLVAVKTIAFQLDATAVLIAVTPSVKLSRPTALPTGGTVLAKGQNDTLFTASTSVICRGATASDGGAATAITATGGAMMKGEYAMRLHTAAGQVLMPLMDLIAPDAPIILRAGESLVVIVDSPVTTSNPATNHWQVDCVWEEFTAS